MNNSAPEREQALRWLMANRRRDVSIEQAMRLLCTLLPRDLATMQLLRRIAEEVEATEPTASELNWRPLPGLPPRG